jgi:UDP-GlcNAc:undecaprenyl-phosphate GlcNAc-1-phosphate transferase
VLKYAVLAALAAGIAFLLTPRVRALALRLGAIDEPGGRRIHQGRVPRLGGIGVFAAFLTAIAVGRGLDLFGIDVFFGHGAGWRWVLGGAIVVAGVGAVDDLRKVGPAVKLLFQLVAGLMVLVGGHGITVVTNPFSGKALSLGGLSDPITLVWVIGITNAFNLIDGLDGLAAGVALIASWTLFMVSLTNGAVDVAILSATLAGSLAGFLYYNFNPASIFLGDSGSLLLGYLLSVLSIQSAHKEATAVVILVPILALGVPIMDILLSMARRLLGALHIAQVDPERNEYRFLFVRSASVFRADRNHIHHRLMRLGFTQKNVVLLLYTISILLGLLAFLSVALRGSSTAALVAIVASAVYVGIRKLGYQEVEIFRRGALLPLFQLPVVNRRLFHAMVDAGLVCLSYAFAFFVVASGPLVGDERDYLLRTVVPVAVAKLAAFGYSGIYWRTYRYTNMGDLLRLLKGMLAAEVVEIVVLAAAFGLPPHVLPVLLLDFYLSATCVVGTRVSFKVFEVLARRTEPIGDGCRVLIYGAGATGTAFLRETEQAPALGYEVVGFIDDYAAWWGHEVNGVRVLGGIDKLGDLIDRHGVREVIVASRNVPPDRLDAAMIACGPRGVPLRRFQITLDQVRPETAAVAEQPQ